MTLDTFDIEIKRVFERQPNFGFILNGRLVYGIRLRQLDSSFGTLTGWIKDFFQNRDKVPPIVWIKEDGIAVFISCKLIGFEEDNGKPLGQFSIGDDWEGEAFSFVAPIETVMNTIYQRMSDYALRYPMDFSEHP